MKSYIKEITIFSKNGDKRCVPLQPGVNIITGESKTGKSALVEIIDYCLCSARCTIPKGKITDFAYLYALTMVVGNNAYVIARYNWNDGGKMLVIKKEEIFEPATLTLTFFADKYPLNYKQAQYEIEAAFGLLVTNMETNNSQNSKKASLRNMVSYLFQHQNLIASKFALFYRFSDYYKRKDAIEQFPVFSGMINQEYYSDLLLLNTLNMQLKQRLKQQKENEKSMNYVRNNLITMLQDYFALLGQDFDENISTKEALNIATKLPLFDDAHLFGEEKITERYSEIKQHLENLRNNEREILIKIKNIEKSTSAGDAFGKMLIALKEQTPKNKIKTTDYICPLCGQDYNKLKLLDEELLEANQWLDNELTLTHIYTSDFTEDLRKLKEEQATIETEIKTTWNELKNIEQNLISSKKLFSKKEKIDYTKAKIELYLELYKNGIFDTVTTDNNDLKNEIDLLNKKIQGFDLDNKKAKAQAFLSENMNRLALTLDFEEEYRPLNLNFSLLDDSFDLYQHQDNRSNIYLSEMGSGANWLSCHIALFLSLLRYFTMQKNSPMPHIMFFDQPSQVYFPQATPVNIPHSPADIIAVNKIYKTIFDEVNAIGNDTGILPQIIIVDHVTGDNLEIKDEFNNYVRRNWRDGKGLI